MTDHSLLLVDDDQDILDMVREYLERDAFSVLTATRCRSALQITETRKFSLAVLDMRLPDGNGLDLMREMRARRDVPVIVLSGLHEDADKIIAIEAGADDYLTKPFSLRELRARINAVLRRSRPSGPAAPKTVPAPLRFDGWTLDPAQYQTYDLNGNSANLTTGEFLILHALAGSPRRTLSRDQLADVLESFGGDAYDRAVDVKISRIRQKLGDDPGNPKYIRTVRHIGYMFCGDVMKAV